MAHRVNVVQVAQEFKSADSVKEVSDPICKREMKKGSVKHMLFQGENTYYFCSKDCLARFKQERFGLLKTA